MRDLVGETRVSSRDLVYPLFVDATATTPQPVPSMPGVERHTLESLVKEAEAAEAAGVPAVILFGVPQAKDAEGSGAWSETGIVQRALRRLEEATDLLLVADVCLCEYTSHGHCGLLHEGDVANDASLDLHARTAASLADAGAHVVAPSGMLDGQVQAIREALDDAGHVHTPILSYAAKYASAYYGPFRDAADSTPAEGDRRSHQIDPGNAAEALREVALDLEEGADMVMVKPALPYLDVVRRVRERFDVPTLAYQVSGEYAQVMAAAERGWVDREAVVLESLTSIKRAGASAIVTYFAREAAELLRE